MKKVLMLLAFATALHLGAQAQIKIPTSTNDAVKNFTAPPSFTDAGKTAGDITDLLTSKLSLDGKQKTSTLDAITGFLGNKKDILGLAKTNPSDYLKKFNPLQSGLFGKLKGIMGAAKFANFMNLKPSGKNIAGNLLSNLFF
jgi:hypothetical protein